MINKIVTKIKESKSLYDFKNDKRKLLNDRKKEILSEIERLTNDLSIELKHIEMELLILK